MPREEWAEDAGDGEFRGGSRTRLGPRPPARDFDVYLIGVGPDGRLLVDTSRPVGKDYRLKA